MEDSPPASPLEFAILPGDYDARVHRAYQQKLAAQEHLSARALEVAEKKANEVGGAAAGYHS